MSEAVRSYSTGRSGFDAPTPRGRSFRRLLLVLVGIGLFWLYWSTRDTYPIERLVPRDQAFHLRAEHLLVSRQKAAASPLWQLGLLPEQYKAVPAWLGNNFGLPDWVLNNLVSDVCYVSGTDFAAFSDLLVVTRMSRIGCLIERYHTFVDGIEDEYAGGLELRRMVDADMYYAVRGRTLVFSPSRDALIGALTLQEDDSVESIEDTIAAAGGDVQGQFTLPDGDPVGQYIARADFALSFEPDSVQFSSQSIVRPEWRALLDTLAAGGPESRLLVATDGAAVIAGDLNAPLPDVWHALDQMAGGALSGFVAGLPVPGNSETLDQETWRAFLEQAQRSLGSAFALRFMGFDPDGIVPMPVAELYLETPGGIAALLENIPALEAGREPAPGVPYRDPETGIVHCPIGWGGVVQPAFRPEREGVRVALLPAHLRDASAGGSPATGNDGHLFMRVRPTEALEVLREAGLLYAASGLIRGHTAETFETAITEAILGSRQVSEARLTAKYDAGALTVDFFVELAGTDPETPPDS